MKKKKQRNILFLAVAAIILCLTFPETASADEATSYTYTLDDNGDFIRTQDAYLPDRTITDLGLSSASDLFVDGENMLYIADTGNRRIVKYSIDLGEQAGILAYGEFSSPSGVFVTENGNIYVADSGAKAVFVFDRQFELLEKLTKPEAPAFADTNFEPKKVAVDGGGNIYLISEGVYNGVIQLASTGDFLGYFAVNDANLTLSQRIQRVIFTRAQLANLVDANPSVFTNVFVDQEGIVYTATSGISKNGMKKHSTNGGNMFKTTVYCQNTLTDVYVDRSGLIYTSSSEGYMDIYSKNGELIFEFGSYVTTTDVVGLFTKLPAIAVDMNGSIWAVDGNKGYLQSFKTTEYAQMVYNAMNLYEQGLYDEAMVQWNEVLKLNQMSVLAHDGVGKAYLHAQDYESALTHFEVANDKEYYSEAFWEVRNTWLQKYLGWILLVILIWIIGKKVIRAVDRKKGNQLSKAGEQVKGKLRRTPLIGDILYAFRTSRHPADYYYDIGRNGEGSAAAATILYLLFFVVFMLFKTKKGFIYQYTDVQDMDIGFIVLGFFLMLGLFILCNYLVTSINDGNGTFRQIYIIPAYGCIPAMISLLGVTVVSHGLTYNESFLLTIALLIGIGWSVIVIFIGLQTVHQYSFSETVLSLVLTLMFMIIIAVIGIILSIMWNSLYSFLCSVGKEMIQNVF